MLEDSSEQIEILPVEPIHWVAGSIFTENLDELYDFDELIFQGRFSAVNKYRLKNRDILRAIKSIPKTENRKTPLILSSIVLQLDHSNLIVLRDIVETATHLHVVQDFVDGPNLFQWIAHKDVYSEPDVSTCTLQILKALQYMHEKEIFHGNLHSGNVLIRTDGDQGSVACLCDYAYTSLCPQEARTNLVHHSPVVCAPEILRGQLFSASSDLWQLGLMIYVCFVGEYPFHGTPKKIFRQILNGSINYNQPEWKDVSINGLTFVMDLLKADTNARMPLNQALTHPWLHKRVYRSDTLVQAQEKIRALIEPPTDRDQ